MNKHTITIHGDKFSDLETFYDEIDNVLEAVLGFMNMKNL